MNGNTDDPENSDDSGNTDRTDGEGNKNTPHKSSCRR